jgi:hypothetical protein
LQWHAVTFCTQIRKTKTGGGGRRRVGAKKGRQQMGFFQYSRFSLRLAGKINICGFIIKRDSSERWIFDHSNLFRINDKDLNIIDFGQI